LDIFCHDLVTFSAITL